MDLISIRVDDALSEKIKNLMIAYKISRSEAIRMILKSGTQSLSIEKNYLEKIYDLSLQNWVFLKTLLEESTSKGKFEEVRKLAKSMLEQNIIEQ